MQGSVLIRPPHENELVLLPEIEKHAEQLFPQDRLTPTTQPIALETLRRSLQTNALLIAEVDQALVGFCAGEIIETDFHIIEIDVLPCQGKRGTGTQLLKASIENARQLGCQRITLTTFSDFPWNGPFYKKMGFVEVKASANEARLTAQLAKERAMGYSRRIAMVQSIDEK